jgi:hypothetical protein
MHAGWPIVAPFKEQISIFKEMPSWGICHEIAHNYQAPFFTPRSPFNMGETTNNMLTLILRPDFFDNAVLDKLEKETMNIAFDYLLSKNKTPDAWDLLSFYYKLIDNFGSDFIRESFKEFDLNSPNDHLLWLKTMSKHLGFNLLPLAHKIGFIEENQKIDIIGPLPELKLK